MMAGWQQEENGMGGKRRVKKKTSTHNFIVVIQTPEWLVGMKVSLFLPPGFSEIQYPLPPILSHCLILFYGVKGQSGFKHRGSCMSLFSHLILVSPIRTITYISGTSRKDPLQCRSQAKSTHPFVPSNFQLKKEGEGGRREERTRNISPDISKWTWPRTGGHTYLHFCFPIWSSLLQEDLLLQGRKT